MAGKGVEVGGRGVDEAGTGVMVGACVSVGGCEVIVGCSVSVACGDVAGGAWVIDVSVALGWQLRAVRSMAVETSSVVKIFIFSPTIVIPDYPIHRMGC